MKEKSKIIIHNYTELDDFTAINFVRDVIAEGKISTTKKGEQYCFVTTFKNGITVMNTTKINNTYTFVVRRD